MPAQPVDPRTRRSRAALAAALLELMAERDLTQISISDVTKRAGVNRSTFYEHFIDLEDLAAAACTTVFDELVATAPVSGWSPGMDAHLLENRLPTLFAHVAEHARLYRALLGAEGSARVINHLLQRIATEAHVRRGSPEDDGDSHDPVAAFVAGAVLGTIIDWVGRGCPGTPEQVGAAVWPLLVRTAPPGA